MKAVIVVEPAFLRDLESGEVEIVLPNSPRADVEAMKTRLESLLEDPRRDVIFTISFPGSPKVSVVGAEKVKGIVSA